MLQLTVRFTRGKDKKDVLSVLRSDGTQTWQHQPAGIPLHDLTHFAVETTLGLRSGFYGLLSAGWDIERLIAREVRRELPPEALWTELVVGLVQAERTGPEPLGEDEFNRLLEMKKENFALPYDRRLNDDELSEIRLKFADLFARWRALAPGECMTVTFP